MGRHRAGEQAHPALAGVIGRHQRLTDQPFDRGHVDDRATTCLHPLDGQLCSQEHAVQVAGKRVTPLRQRHLLNVAERPHARVVDQYIEPTEKLLAGEHDLLPLRLIGNVMFVERDRQPLLSQCVGSLHSSHFIEVGQQHTSTFSREYLCRCQTYSPGRAGDQAYTLVQTSHYTLLIAHSDRHQRRVRRP